MFTHVTTSIKLIEHLDKAVKIIDRLTEDTISYQQEINRLRAELQIRKEQITRMPFCPDHRDKVRGLPCRECEIERLNSIIKKLKGNE